MADDSTAIELSRSELREVAGYTVTCARPASLATTADRRLSGALGRPEEDPFAGGRRGELDGRRRPTSAEVDERTPGGIRTRIKQNWKISPPGATDYARSASVTIASASTGRDRRI